MAKCPDCRKKMTGNGRGVTCSANFRCIMIDGEIYPRDTAHFDYNAECHDCGIVNKLGNLHHFGCDVERCPRCEGQLISCDCNKEKLGVNGSWHEVK